MEEMSVENLLFWLEVQEYSAIKAPEYRRHIARKIYRKYIQARPVPVARTSFEATL